MGLSRDGTSHGTYESRSCLFSLGRPVCRKAGKNKNKKTMSQSVHGSGFTTVCDFTNTFSISLGFVKINSMTARL